VTGAGAGAGAGVAAGAGPGAGVKAGPGKMANPKDPPSGQSRMGRAGSSCRCLRSSQMYSQRETSPLVIA